MRPSHALPALLSAFALSACVIHVQESTVTLPVDEPFSAVVVDLDAGAATVRLVEGADPVADVTLEWSCDEAPEAEVFVSEGVLYVVGDCPDGAWYEARICNVNVDLQVPAGVPVEVWTGSGDVTVSGMESLSAETGSGDVTLQDLAGGATLATGSGDVTIDGAGGFVCLETGSGNVVAKDVGADLDIRTDSGDVTVADVAGDLFVDTGSGDVDGTGLAGPRATAWSGSGDVELQLSGSVDEVDVQSGSGDLELEVPAGAYAMTLETGSGEVDLIAVDDDPDAAARLRAVTGSGDIRVTGR